MRRTLLGRTTAVALTVPLTLTCGLVAAGPAAAEPPVHAAVHEPPVDSSASLNSVALTGPLGRKLK
jgi:hypothetical protein